uniref:PAZ domain-containing protein n=1 Tax=Panagrolaimus davidi TaxID=227884 RepID=A0A914PMS3_9BILA
MSSDESNASTGGSSPPNEMAHADDKNKFGAKRQALATLNHLGLELADPIVYDKDQAVRGTIQNGDTQINVSTNIFGLKTIACDIYLYHLEFVKVFESGKHAGKSYPVVDPHRKEPDFTTYQNRLNYEKLFKAFFKKYPNVFGNNQDNLCYDYGATLYSLVELVSFDTPMVLTEHETNEAIGRIYKTTLTVKKPQDNIFNVRDLTRFKSLDLSKQPHHVIRFLELVTSRHAASLPDEYAMYESKRTYFMKPEEHGFNLLPLGGGKYLAAGASKTVACIEGPKNKRAAAVIVESKKTPFFHAMNLLELLCAAVNVKPSVVINMDQFRDCVQVVKRLEVFPSYGNRQNACIRLSGLTEGDALTTLMESNGEEICIAEYFFRHYGITLQYPHWPLAIGAKKVYGNKPSYPVELLIVADYQRVGNDNITSTDIATIVKSCAVLPAIKKLEIDSCYRSFSFGVDAFMQKAGMSVLEEPLKVPARVLKGFSSS